MESRFDGAHAGIYEEAKTCLSDETLACLSGGAQACRIMVPKLDFVKEPSLISMNQVGSIMVLMLVSIIEPRLYNVSIIGPKLISMRWHRLISMMLPDLCH